MVRSHSKNFLISPCENYNELINKEYEKLLSRTEILNKGFDFMFENYNDENNFMFLDPPYDSEFTDYGYCQFGKEQQQQLAVLFKNTKKVNFELFSCNVASIVCTQFQIVFPMFRIA